MTPNLRSAIIRLSRITDGEETVEQNLHGEPDFTGHLRDVLVALSVSAHRIQNLELNARITADRIEMRLDSIRSALLDIDDALRATS